MGNARRLGGLLNPNSSVGALSNRNLIINGNFEINQRGRSGSYTSTGFEYGFDRWAMAKNDVVNYTWEFDYFSNGFIDIPEAKGLVQFGLNSAGSGTDFVRLEQRIEDVKTLSNQTCTLSFWARSATGSSFTLNQTALTTGPVGLMQYFGTGGTPSSVVDIPFTQSITLNTAWTKYTYTIDVPSISGKTIGTTGNDHLRVYICGMDDDDVGKTVQVAQVQLERGDTATPFEHRSYADELRACKRYYHVYEITGWERAGSGVGFMGWHNGVDSTYYSSYLFPVEMRAAPTAACNVSGTPLFRLYRRGATDTTSLSDGAPGVDTRGGDLGKISASLKYQTVSTYNPGSIGNLSMGGNAGYIRWTWDAEL